MAISKFSIAGAAGFSLISALFVGWISWATFDEFWKVALATGATFVITLLSILALTVFAKEDEAVAPGKPRLK